MCIDVNCCNIYISDVGFAFESYRLEVLLLFQWSSPTSRIHSFLKEKFFIILSMHRITSSELCTILTQSFPTISSSYMLAFEHSLFITAKSKISTPVLLLYSQGSFCFSALVTFWSSTSSLFIKTFYIFCHSDTMTVIYFLVSILHHKEYINALRFPVTVSRSAFFHQNIQPFMKFRHLFLS